MPNYDYDCLKCGHAFEVFQSMKDDPLDTCPKCKKRAVKRRIGGGAGLIFKGTGFYITDYKNQKPAAEKSTPAETKPAKTEAKTAE